mmetsp:Transcript_23189/g.36535  ORF Transcript_23189/g.36535 Transcript_23189/m.36535 type:complete len:80 (-) Transcript_23189:50-289(-)
MIQWQRDHIREMFSALDEEIRVLEQFEGLGSAATQQQVGAYLKSLEAMVEHRNELCKSLNNNLQSLKPQLFSGANNNNT